jgi:glycerate kinase
MTTLSVVVTPSGFKESLDAEEAAAAIADGIRRASPEAEIIQIPLVDGGRAAARAEGQTQSAANDDG